MENPTLRIWRTSTFPFYDKAKFLTAAFNDSPNSSVHSFVCSFIHSCTYFLDGENPPERQKKNSIFYFIVVGSLLSMNTRSTWINTKQHHFTLVQIRHSFVGTRTHAHINCMLCIWVTNCDDYFRTRSDLRHKAKKGYTIHIHWPPRLTGQPEMLDNNPFIYIFDNWFLPSNAQHFTSQSQTNHIEVHERHERNNMRMFIFRYTSTHSLSR